MTFFVPAIARVLGGVLPYPDLVRRVRVRRQALDLATRDPLPPDESAMTGLDYARLALLRSLWLQHETHRAVRSRQQEAAALLARTSMETCILGLWCLHHPNAAVRLRQSEIKNMPAMLSFLSSASLIPDAVIRQAVDGLGEPEKLPDVRSMTTQIDEKTGATLAIHLYDQAYRPASQYFTHATSSALLRHVTHKRRYATRPANPWVRQAPVRIADACLGLLAGAIAHHVSAPAEQFQRYAEAHAGRVLPPLLATVGKGLARKLSVSDLVQLLKQSLALRMYLARPRSSDEATVEREARLRDLYDAAIARVDLDLPPEATKPIADHFVASVLAAWDAEAASVSSGPAS